ncbi:nectin-4 isoform X2 [Austrofundulus limnaeus]|uniref:Nectin-4 isoform X2 n=1 Tax=Austrofundulus limnaeus TaxID=52670 RepID=A0A2I4CEJ5_AUSLI|nr:PREDICTED: nectin-4 isoform X2 [Austrofundulus limnaeus]
MTSLLNSLSLCLCALLIHVTVGQGQIQTVTVNQPLKLSIRSVEEQETTLPCHYEPQEGEVVVQVTWFKVNADGSKEQMITAHFEEGQTAFGLWFKYVRFKSDKPTVDSSLIILSTRVSDEGEYICRSSIFPAGSFDTEMFLVVWTSPISSVDPVVVVEEESSKKVASCRSVGRPPPMLSWDTELKGQVINRSSDNGAVSTHFSLYPRRGMNGKKLDCLVWHPLLPTPRRIENRLEVLFPPVAEVYGYKEDWTVSMENAVLRCINGGNPKPVVTWTREGGALPKGTQVTGDELVFIQPLNFSDGGTYECMAKNKLGEAKATVTIALKGPYTVTEPDKMIMIYIGCGAAALFLLMVILIIILICHHKRKKQKLKTELSKKTEECTLYRQASFRRVNSVNTERDVTEENIPLRVEGTLRTSLSSLGELAHCRDSRSTISCGRGGLGAYDSLGRPSLNNNSRRGRLFDRDEEARLRVESYVKNSNMSLSLSQESRYQPPLTPSTFPAVHQTEALRHMNGNAVMPADGGSRPGSFTKTYQPPPVSCTYPPVTDDEDEVDEGLGGPASQEHPDDQDSEHSGLSDFSKLRKSPPIINPHKSIIHKAHIV